MGAQQFGRRGLADLREKRMAGSQVGMKEGNFIDQIKINKALPMAA